MFRIKIVRTIRIHKNAINQEREKRQIDSTSGGGIGAFITILYSREFSIWKGHLQSYQSVIVTILFRDLISYVPEKFYKTS